MYGERRSKGHPLLEIPQFRDISLKEELGVFCVSFLSSTVIGTPISNKCLFFVHHMTFGLH